MNHYLYRLSLILSVSYLVFSFCSCGTQPSAQGDKTPEAKVSPTSASASASTSPTTMSVPTVSTPTVSTSCPSAGTARPAVMPTLALGHSQNIVYIYNQGSYQQPVKGILRRYDLSTHTKTDIVKLSNTWLNVVYLSTDSRWALFLSRIAGHDMIQLVRMDGQYLQTLYCSTSSQNIAGGFTGGLAWSPDQRSLMFSLTTTGDANSPPVVLDIYLLDMITGKLHMELGAVNAFPSIWLDNLRVYLINPLIHMTPAPEYISVWDSGKSAQEQQTNPIGTVNLCGDFDVNPDRTQLLLSRCSDPIAGGKTGPSTITTQPAAGGPAHVIYSNQTLAISTIRVISNTTLLLIVYSNSGDRSQNGLWKINSDGSNRTLLESNDPLSSYLNLSREPVSRDGSLYSFVKTDFKPSGAPVSTSLAFGSLNGGGLTTIASLGPEQGSMVLVGWTTL